jgi:SAM-dependent methyltransferase
MKEIIENLFAEDIEIENNIIRLKQDSKTLDENQSQTKDIFAEKWTKVDAYNDVNALFEFQYEWFLNLYGFDNLNDLKLYLRSKKVIIDTGCGLGYKAAWLADITPESLVIGIDISDAAIIAAKNYQSKSNLYFLKADIANTGIINNSIDFTICDQVIMHTEDPELTFKHLADITKKNGEFACYVYRKKALPRELIDDYFRTQTHNISKEEMWEFSSQLTQLGKTLSELNIQFNAPDIPLLGIKGGSYDIQRFIYWNFLKCF